MESHLKNQIEAVKATEGILINSTSGTIKNYKPVQMLPEGDKLNADKHPCKFCTDSAYLSMIRCEHHNFNYCIGHRFMCGCSAPSIYLVYRFNTPDLGLLLAKIDADIDFTTR
jgi:hypothetical protein